MAAHSRRDVIAQWAFDTRPAAAALPPVAGGRGGRVAPRRVRKRATRSFDFVPADIRRCLAMTAGVTALGTRLFARFGEGKGADKQTLNQVKKDADAISAYVTSEALWHFSRKLPENHAIMVCLGEGLMPKAGETPEMGANPLLGFGRVYARPRGRELRRIARAPPAERPGLRLARLLQEDARPTASRIWGAAVDTLENTSRFAKGEELGPHDRDPPVRPAAHGGAALRGLHGQRSRSRARWRARPRRTPSTSTCSRPVASSSRPSS